MSFTIPINEFRYPLRVATLAVALAALTVHAAPPTVTGVTVAFSDGTEQHLVASTQPDIAPATSPSTAPTTRSHAWTRPILGINLETPRDYERQFMFIDVIKTSRPWGTADKPYDQKGPVGPDGWPSGDAGTCALTEMKNVNGVYKFSATGACELATPGSAASVENLRYDPALNRTTADIVLKANPERPTTLNLVFRKTAGGLKDIKLLRPGYTSDAQVFTSEFLNALAPFDAIRFMDYLRTNDSVIRTWDQRCKVSDPQYTLRGGPYEHAVLLGNKLKKDIWLNIPALADDDFVAKLGALVREQLDPDLHCYVEYSNEVWNGQFKQCAQNLELAKSEVAAGDTTLNDGGKDSNIHYWARRRVARRGVEIKKLMGADDPRIRVVLASQVGYSPPGAVLKTQLDYVQKHFGPPARFFFAVAGAPYFSPGRDETDPARKKWYTERTDLTADALAARLLEKSVLVANENVMAFHTLARQHDLRSFAYEGGLDMQQYGTALEAKIACQYDLRTGQAVEQYIDKWYASGGDAMFYFTLSCKYSKFGYWGLTEDVRELLTPKYMAATRVTSRLRAR